MPESLYSLCHNILFYSYLRLMTYRVLVVDDEADVQEILQFNLRSEGYHVDTAASSEEALTMDLPSYHLFILDVMMGKLSGFKLADRIRTELNIKSPIIFLTARNEENDMLTGFSLGADDYIRKPFSIVELKARVKAVLARSLLTGETTGDNVGIGSLNINTGKKEVQLEGKVIELTRKEYQILLLLVKNSGSFVPRDDILESVWSDTLVSERTVDVHITRLRKRLGSFGSRIKSRTGYGYYIDEKSQGNDS
ncbi:MAG: response regulator transcription factor [Bacteroidales bacterium]|nr:response regulator transcription factor [Bacteroidales bacterium]